MADMISDMEAHFRGLVPERDELLLELEAEAKAADIRIVGPLVGALLTMLCRWGGVRLAVELGTASGYSAIHLGRGLAAGGRLYSFERDPAMAARARTNLGRAGLADAVRVEQGEALTLLSEMEGPVDLIFLDIEKADYARALPDCRRLLRRGGLLVADNTAFAGAADFNRQVLEDRAFEAVNLLGFLPGHSPERDGLLLALRT